MGCRRRPTQVQYCWKNNQLNSEEEMACTSSYTVVNEVAYRCMYDRVDMSANMTQPVCVVDDNSILDAGSGDPGSGDEASSELDDLTKVSACALAITARRDCHSSYIEVGTAGNRWPCTYNPVPGTYPTMWTCSANPDLQYEC